MILNEKTQYSFYCCSDILLRLRIYWAYALIMSHFFRQMSKPGYYNWIREYSFSPIVDTRMSKHCQNIMIFSVSRFSKSVTYSSSAVCWFPTVEPPIAPKKGSSRKKSVVTFNRWNLKLLRRSLRWISIFVYNRNLEIRLFESRHDS